MADLGWTAVLEHIAEHAVNEATVTRLLQTVPYTSRTDAERVHTWVAEAITLFTRDVRVPVRSTNPIELTLATLQRGATPSGPELRDVARAAEQALALRAHTFTHRDYCPTLASSFDIAPSLRELTTTLSAALDETGQLYDTASEGLHRARRDLSKAREALRQTQSELL